MIVKRILPIMLLVAAGSFGLRAQDQTAPPTSPPGRPDAARLQEALRKAAAATAGSAATAPTNAPFTPSGQQQPATGTPLGTPVPFDPSGRPPTSGRPLPPPGGRPADPNSIVTPTLPPFDPNKPPPDQIAIVPSLEATNSSLEQIVEVGTIDFKGVDVNQVLMIYAEYVNKTILRPATLAGAPVWLSTQTPLTKREVIQAFDAVLGMSGIAMKIATRLM